VALQQRSPGGDLDFPNSILDRLTETTSAAKPVLVIYRFCPLLAGAIVSLEGLPVAMYDWAASKANDLKGSTRSTGLAGSSGRGLFCFGGGGA
jgi:hypothetical protein